MRNLVVAMAAWERGRERERKKESRRKAWWKVMMGTLHCNAEISQVICANYWQFPRHRLEALSRTLARVKAEKATEISQLEQGKLNIILCICTSVCTSKTRICKSSSHVSPHELREFSTWIISVDSTSQYWLVLNAFKTSQFTEFFFACMYSRLVSIGKLANTDTLKRTEKYLLI